MSNLIIIVYADYRWVCKDFPDLQLAVDNNILSDFDPNEYVVVHNYYNVLYTAMGTNKDC